MATTKIWPVKDSLARVVDYAQNPNKTIYSDLQQVLHYAANDRGFRGLYLHYCYCLGILPKGSNHRPLSPELREECRRLDAISSQAQLIRREKLDTAEDVVGFISEKQAEIKELGVARQKCYNRLRRCGDGAKIAQIKAQRNRLTAAMAVCRKDIKTAEGVLSRSDQLKENLKLEQEMQAQRMGRTQNRKMERSVAR